MSGSLGDLVLPAVCIAMTEEIRTIRATAKKSAEHLPIPSGDGRVREFGLALTPPHATTLAPTGSMLPEAPCLRGPVQNIRLRDSCQSAT